LTDQSVGFAQEVPMQTLVVCEKCGAFVPCSSSGRVKCTLCSNEFTAAPLDGSIAAMPALVRRIIGHLELFQHTRKNMVIKIGGSYTEDMQKVVKLEPVHAKTVSRVYIPENKKLEQLALPPEYVVFNCEDFTVPITIRASCMVNLDILDMLMKNHFLPEKITFASTTLDYVIVMLTLLALPDWSGETMATSVEKKAQRLENEFIAVIKRCYVVFPKDFLKRLGTVPLDDGGTLIGYCQQHKMRFPTELPPVSQFAMTQKELEALDAKGTLRSMRYSPVLTKVQGLRINFGHFPRRLLRLNAPDEWKTFVEGLKNRAAQAHTKLKEQQ